MIFYNHTLLIKWFVSSQMTLFSLSCIYMGIHIVGVYDSAELHIILAEVRKDSSIMPWITVMDILISLINNKYVLELSLDYTKCPDGVCYLY